MKIYSIDYDGNMLLNPSFFQYDAGQLLRLTDIAYNTTTYQTSAPIVHFWNASCEQPITRPATLVSGSGVAGSANAIWEAEIPNSLLSVAKPITVAVYISTGGENAHAKTIGLASLTVQRRLNPDFEIEDNESTPITATELLRLLGQLDPSDTSYVDRFDSVLEEARLAALAAQHGLDEDADTWMEAFQSDIADKVYDLLESVDGEAY